MAAPGATVTFYLTSGICTEHRHTLNLVGSGSGEGAPSDVNTSAFDDLSEPTIETKTSSLVCVEDIRDTSSPFDNNGMPTT